MVFSVHAWVRVSQSSVGMAFHEANVMWMTGTGEFCVFEGDSGLDSIGALALSLEDWRNPRASRRLASLRTPGVVHGN